MCASSSQDCQFILALQVVGTRHVQCNSDLALTRHPPSQVSNTVDVVFEVDLPMGAPTTAPGAAPNASIGAGKKCVAARHLKRVLPTCEEEGLKARRFHTTADEMAASK